MDTNTLKGKIWSAKKVDQIYIVSINNDESILDALTDFVKSEKINTGYISGIGAAKDATLRFFDPKIKQYVDKAFNEQLEISNLNGNISSLDNQPLLHLHVTLGRQNFTALAGHLLNAKISGAGEFYIFPLDTTVIKKKNENLGINLYDF